MIEIWKAMETKLKEMAPKILDSLYKGVTDKKIAALEGLINTKLPAEFIAFYKIHDGQNPDAGGLIYCEELLSFDRIEDEWKIWKDLLDKKTFEDEEGPYTSSPDPGIKDDWWNPLWIPITYDGAGNHYCLDLDPAKKGQYGQIIRMWHDDEDRTLVANSFKEWITEYKDRLVKGELIYSEDYGGIMDEEDAE